MKNVMNQIKRYSASKAIKNGMWLYALQIFNTIVPLISLPYITRILGKNNYGVFAFSLNIVEYLNVIVEYGFNYSGTRRIAFMKNHNEIRHTFVSIFYAKLLLLFLCLGGLNIFLNHYKMAYDQRISCYILVLSTCGVALQQTWLFQGLQKMHYITIISIIARTISLVLIFILVQTAGDLWKYCILYSITPIIIGVLGVIVSVHILKPMSWEFHIFDILNEIKIGWYTFTTSLSSKIFSAVGITILGVVSTRAQVGIYSAINKIPTALLLMWAPISQVLYPISSQKMKNNFENGQRYVKNLKNFFSIIFIIISTVICLLSRIIVKIAFGEDYAEYYYILIPLIVWVNLGIWNNFIGIQTLLAAGFDSIYSRCFQISVVMTIILNVILINVWDIVGAALAPMFSELILHILLILGVKRLNIER